MTLNVFQTLLSLRISSLPDSSISPFLTIVRVRKLKLFISAVGHFYQLNSGLFISHAILKASLHCQAKQFLQITKQNIFPTYL